MYQKDKYKFSSNTSLVLMGRDVKDARGLEAVELNKELAEYGILMKDLIAVDFDDKTRDEILNIAMYISQDAELYGDMETAKELPIAKLIRNVAKTRKCLESWKDYIIAYSLILGNYKYRYLNDYLRVIENADDGKEDQKVIHLKNVINFNDENDAEEDLAEENEEADKEVEQDEKPVDNKIIRGVIVSKNRKMAIIMTSNGVFKKISIDNESVRGEEVSGKRRKRLKDFRKILIPIASIVIIAILVATYLYTKVVSTVVIEAGTSVRLEINSINRVVNVISTTDAGDEIINNTNVKDKDIDEAVCRIIKYSIDNNKINSAQTITITVTGEAVKYGVLEKTSKYVEQENIGVKFNNAGYQKKF